MVGICAFQNLYCLILLNKIVIKAESNCMFPINDRPNFQFKASRSNDACQGDCSNFVVDFLLLIAAS